MGCFHPFIQAAAAYALDNQERLVAPMKDECAGRRKIVVEALEGIDGLEVNRIEDTFYAFPKYGLQVGSLELAEMLLREQRVAVIPGIGFGPSGGPVPDIVLPARGGAAQGAGGAPRVLSPAWTRIDNITITAVEGLYAASTHAMDVHALKDRSDPTERATAAP